MNAIRAVHRHAVNLYTGLADDCKPPYSDNQEPILYDQEITQGLGYGEHAELRRKIGGVPGWAYLLFEVGSRSNEYYDPYKVTPFKRSLFN